MISKKLRFIIGILLLVSLTPVPGISQTSDDDKADKTERTHRKHVVKKAWSDTKQTTAKDYHAAARATGKAWRGTKRGVSKGYHAAVRAPGKGIHKAEVKHQEREKQEGETK
jgi:hypothetical protein